MHKILKKLLILTTILGNLGSVSCKSSRYKKSLASVSGNPVQNSAEAPLVSGITDSRFETLIEQNPEFNLCVSKNKDLSVYLPVICVDPDKSDGKLNLTAEHAEFIDMIVGAGIGVFVLGSAYKISTLFRDGIHTKELSTPKPSAIAKNSEAFDPSTINFSKKKSVESMNQYFDLRYGPGKIVPEATGNHTIRIESLIEDFETRGITSQALGNLQSKIRSIEADEKTLTFCDISVARKLQELEAMELPPVDKIRFLKSTQEHLASYRKSLEVRLA